MYNIIRVGEQEVVRMALLTTESRDVIAKASKVFNVPTTGSKEILVRRRTHLLGSVPSYIVCLTSSQSHM